MLDDFIEQASIKTTQTVVTQSAPLAMQGSAEAADLIAKINRDQQEGKQQQEERRHKEALDELKKIRAALVEAKPQTAKF